jgi:hypothetical protein
VIPFSALRVFNAGNGHLRPVRSNFVVLMSRTWRSWFVASTAERFQAKACLASWIAAVPVSAA